VFLEKKNSFQTIAQKWLKDSMQVERNIRVSFLEKQKIFWNLMASLRLSVVALTQWR